MPVLALSMLVGAGSAVPATALDGAREPQYPRVAVVTLVRLPVDEAPHHDAVERRCSDGHLLGGHAGEEVRSGPGDGGAGTAHAQKHCIGRHWSSGASEPVDRVQQLATLLGGDQLVARGKGFLHAVVHVVVEDLERHGL